MSIAVSTIFIKIVSPFAITHGLRIAHRGGFLYLVKSRGWGVSIKPPTMGIRRLTAFFGGHLGPVFTCCARAKKGFVTLVSLCNVKKGG